MILKYGAICSEAEFIDLNTSGILLISLAPAGGVPLSRVGCCAALGQNAIDNALSMPHVFVAA